MKQTNNSQRLKQIANPSADGLRIERSSSTTMAKKALTRHMGGFTLVELLVALSISMIGLLGGLMVYRSSHRAIDVTVRTNEIQQTARKALDRLTQELQETTVEAIDVWVPNAISFASAWNQGDFAIGVNKKPEWQKAVVYFLNSENQTVYRYTEPRTDWETPFNTSSAFYAPEEDLEPLVTGVTQLDFELDENILTVTVEVSKNMSAAGLNEPIVAQASTQILLRN